MPKKSYVINIVDVQFNVSASGSIYTCSAIPYNHLALTDEVQKVRTTMSISGATVEQMLQSGPESLTNELNRQEQEFVKSGEKIIGDTYTINFPKDVSQSVTNYPSTASSSAAIGPGAGRGFVVEELGARKNYLQAQAEAAVGLDAFGGFAATTQVQQEAAVGLDAFGGAGENVQAIREAAVNLDVFGNPTSSSSVIKVIDPWKDYASNTLGEFGGSVSGAVSAVQQGFGSDTFGEFGASATNIGNNVVSYDAFGDAITQAQAEAAVGLDAFGGFAATTQVQQEAAFGLDAFGPGNIFTSQAQAEAGMGLDIFGPGNSFTVNNSTPASVPYNPNSNVFGNSRIITKFDEFGNNPFGFDALVWDETAGVYIRGGLKIDPDTRVFEFRENTKIEKIIEEVILTSEWGQNLINQTPDPKTKMVDWYKVDVKVKIKSTDESIGRPAYEYIYSVIPYKVHFSIFEDENIQQSYVANVKNVNKIYNYSYTGLNTDIINFEFSLDTSYYKPLVDVETGKDKHIVNVVAEQQTAYGNGKSGVAGSNIDPVTNQVTRNIPVTIQTSNDGGANIDTNKKRIAELFNTLVLNGDVGNTELTLQIWGDPWFLADTDAGNYRSSPSQAYTDSDNAIDLHRSEIDVLIRFNSGVDIQNNLMLLDPVNNFNGLYKVITFTSSFNNGMFMQELKLLRRPAQDAETLSVINSVVDTYLSGVDNTFLNQVISERVSGLSTGINSLYNQIPNELRRFLQIDKFNIGEIEKLSGTAIFDLLNKSQQLLTVGNLLQNNLLGGLGGALGGLKNLQGAVGSVGNLVSGISKAGINIAGIGAVAGNVNTMTSSLTGATQQLTSQLNSAVPQLTSQLNSAVPQLQGGIISAANALAPGTALSKGLATNLNGTTSALKGLTNGSAVGQALDQIPQAFAGLPQTYESLQSNLQNQVKVFSNTLKMPQFPPSAANLIKTGASTISALNTAKNALKSFKL